jgi:hypothetical protein
VVIYRPRPYVVQSIGVASYESASNPIPVVAADIQLINPASNRVTLTYTLDNGGGQTLAAGYSAQINQLAVIEFDRGGGIGRARYSLTDGAYKFVASNGSWDLVRQTAQSVQTAQVATTATNPIPGNWVVKQSRMSMRKRNRRKPVSLFYQAILFYLLDFWSQFASGLY